MIKFDQIFQFSSAVIQNKGGGILLLKRSNSSKHYPGLWQLPEGKIEGKETPAESMKRELEEEIGCTFTPVTLKSICPYSFNIDKINILIIRTLFYIKGKPKIKLSHEHSEYKWVLPKKIIKDKYQLVVGLKEIIEKF